ncbi:MAG TPA: DUF5916 domain-containing protein [Candidatus Eisenbacteria bacterium]|nr:DUF5916 domain-containing protein [Candidatus Eisenbacteria bacterium]
MKLLLAVILCAATAGAALADSTVVVLPNVQAARATSAIIIDGILNDAAWSGPAADARFIQSDPNQGAAPTFPTELRIAYDDDAVYVGVRMFDSAPDSIVARLARRDVNSASDELCFFLDPYHDKRTGYFFVISAAGTLRDGICYNDDWTDGSWDGVWQGRSQIDSLGWTAEMRIPYSQLRFNKSERGRWGVNVRRFLARRNEWNYVSYTPRNQSGFVSRFPDLVGIDGITPHRAIELRPYGITRGEFLQHSPGDPFNDGSKLVPDVGVDLKTSIGSKLTLNATINPDFGQVEVDPAVVNLSDVETFFSEKRPFFFEGSSNYDFGEGGSNSFWGFNWPGPSHFYSRRIGRAPQGVDQSEYSADFVDRPLGTSILGAAKVTGKVAGNWNLGLMQAVTAQERATVLQGGARSKAEIEPLTSYTVMRASREFNGGRQGLGTITTLAARKFDSPLLSDQLNRSSLVAGLDGWTFLDKNKAWVLTGWGSMTDVRGTQARILNLQRNSQHYLQRPDAVRWRVDPTATSLTGYGGRFTLNKQKGATIVNSAVGFINPHWDVNDVGSMSRADIVNAHVVGGYKWTDPKGIRRYADAKVAVWGSTDWDGNLISPGIWTGGGFEFSNYWSIWPRASFNPAAINNRLTRGGPLTRSKPRWDAGFWFETDARKKVWYGVDFGGARSQSGGWAVYVYPSVEWKPASNVSVSVGPGLDRNHQDSQWVGSVADAGATETFGRRYVFSQLDQTTVSANLRLNWAFTPNVSFQMFMQPLVSSGEYFAYKQLVRARSYTWEPVGSGVPQYNGATDQIDLNGAAPDGAFNPDFNVTSLRGNAILRWEYMPASTLFLVWTQDRNGFENSGEFELGDACSRMFDQQPNNIFMAKVSYYFSL